MCTRLDGREFVEKGMAVIGRVVTMLRVPKRTQTSKPQCMWPLQGTAGTFGPSMVEARSLHLWLWRAMHPPAIMIWIRTAL